MKSVDILRYLKGYVIFRGVGGFTERFINLCNFNGIIIRDVVFSDNFFTAKCNTGDYRKLRHISKKSGVKLSLLTKSGLIFDLKEKKERKGLLLGMMFFFLFFLIMSNFVWTVDVSGNEQISKEDILSLGKKHGIFVGTYKPTFNETAAASALALENNNLLDWAAINIKGSRAVIEVREQKKSIRNQDNEIPSNLVADFDGVIISAEVFSGTGCISEGMGIGKGDLLISGTEENEDLSVSFVKANGRIVCQREKNLTVSYNNKAKINTLTESSKKATLYLFGMNIPLSLSLSRDKSFFKDEHYLSYNGIRLPAGIKYRTYYSFEKTTRTIKEHMLSALESFSATSYTNNSDTKILSAAPKIKAEADRIVIACNWDCLDFIGKTQKIITES